MNGIQWLKFKVLNYINNISSILPLVYQPIYIDLMTVLVIQATT